MHDYGNQQRDTHSLTPEDKEFCIKMRKRFTRGSIHRLIYGWTWENNQFEKGNVVIAISLQIRNNGFTCFEFLLPNGAISQYCTSYPQRICEFFE